MSRLIKCASLDWDSSIIDRTAVDRVFAAHICSNQDNHFRLESAKRILIRQSTIFVWSMFEENLSYNDVSKARIAFDVFKTIAEKSSYQPPKIAIEKLEHWLSEEGRREKISHCPKSSFDSVAYPWLIAFFSVVFGQPSGRKIHSSAGRFIYSYFEALWEGIDRNDTEIRDPESRNRVLRKPAIKQRSSVDKAIGRHRAEACQYMALIGDEIASLAASMEISPTDFGA